MDSNYGWCCHCGKSSYLEEVGYKKENTAGYMIKTQEYAGKCKYCGRELRKAIVEAMGGNDEIIS